MLSQEIRGAISHEQLRELISNAVPDFWVVEVYDDYFIAESQKEGSRYFKFSYSLMDGKVILGEKVEVKRIVEYVQVKSSIKISGAGKKDSEDYGYKWRVRVVEFGTDKNGTHWTKEPLIAAISKFEGARVFMLSEAQHQKDDHPYGKPVTEVVGWLSNVTYDDIGIEAELNILRTARHLRDALIDSWERGNPDLFGLSLDLTGVVKKKKGVIYLESVKSVTVDIVYDPAAGGKFLRMAAAIQKEEKMEELKEMLEGLDEKIKAAVQTAINEKMKNLSQDKDPQKILDEARIVAGSIVLKDELRESGLPELSQSRIRKQFEGKVFDVEALRNTIKEEKEYLDNLTGSGAIKGSGDIKVIQSEIDSRIKMLDDFFEGKVHSFRAVYLNLTGDEKFTGRLESATRLKASLTRTSFDQILGDSITRKMVKDYAAAGLDDWKKIAEVVPVGDFRTQRRVRFGGYGNLPVVSEGAAYTALTSPSDEEATYSISKKGGTEDITIEMIRNDDVGAIRRIPTRLARAAARTLYEFVFDFLATNPTIYDATALFTAGHGNLGTAALDATTLAAGRRAMLRQTEAGSNKRLGIGPRYLIVPLELDKIAFDLITPPDTGQYTPVVPDYIKRWRLEMIVVPYWTDTNNWYLVADHADIPTIEIGFLDGNETPELFVQDNPQVGSMFNNDKLTYKIRHIYGGAVIDYRGFYGAIVA